MKLKLCHIWRRGCRLILWDNEGSKEKQTALSHYFVKKLLCSIFDVQEEERITQIFIIKTKKQNIINIVETTHEALILNLEFITPKHVILLLQIGM